MTLELAAREPRWWAGRSTSIRPTSRCENGTMNVLLGPTLSGKTTLMRLMAGLDQPTAGRILWDGRDVTGMRGAGPAAWRWSTSSSSTTRR